MKIAIQGTLGSFHQLVAASWYGDAIEIIACETFADVFRALKEGRADQAVCAIENSLYGSIAEVYDLLLKYRFPIVGEVPEHIHQQLIGFPGTPLASVTKVYSHPVALSQCERFLDEFLPHAERIEHHDTAEAVDFIKKQNNPSYCAIASHAAAELHALNILQENIEDELTNFTRFLILDPIAKPVEQADKASLVIRTNHQSGALHQALSVFARLDMNLTKLQSRPIRGKVWKYQFFVDVEADAARLTQAMTSLESTGCELTLLGHYKAAQEVEVG